MLLWAYKVGGDILPVFIGSLPDKMDSALMFLLRLFKPTAADIFVVMQTKEFRMLTLVSID